MPHGALPLAMVGSVTGTALSWPTKVPVLLHYGRDDPFRSEASVAALAEEVGAAGAAYEYWEYPVAGHLFTDQILVREYDLDATDLLWRRALTFLAD